MAANDAPCHDYLSGLLNCFEDALVILRMLSGFELLCLKKTKDGFPFHPLYVASVTKPIKYSG